LDFIALSKQGHKPLNLLSKQFLGWLKRLELSYTKKGLILLLKVKKGSIGKFLIVRRFIKPESKTKCLEK